MSQVCDFYIECAELDCVPVERGVTIPEGIELASATVTNRRGEPIAVTGVTIAGAIAWANSKGGAPEYVVSFLETFADCTKCSECRGVFKEHFSTLQP